MVETLTGSARSAGISYDDVLKTDTRQVPPILKENHPINPGPTKVPVTEFFSRDFFNNEVEKLWKRVWQLACHEDDIPNVGDTYVYDIANLSYIVIRTSADSFAAFPNACLHRGRTLVDADKKAMKAIRCAFHGWSWNLDGSLKEIPCQWDFPSVDESNYSLPPIKVDTWGGFVFINPDPNSESLKDFLGDIDRHFETLPFERRYKAVHVAKKLRCNWKVAQSAFMESYHVVATHPTLLTTLGDANSKYDVFGNVSRAISPHGVPSPHTHSDTPGQTDPEATPFTRHRHVLTGHVYERLGEDRIKLILPDGRWGIFDAKSNHLEGEVQYADPHICDWFGGKLIEGMEEMGPEPGPASIAEFRAAEAQVRREGLRPVLGDRVDDICDAELLDSIYYSVFPNISPWGCFSPIFYRFRPNGTNPEECIHEVMFMLPAPEGEPRPAPAKVQWLDFDDDYTQAPQLGFLAKVFNQDQLNLAQVQKGMHSSPTGEVIFADYQESKIRHFHEKLDFWLSKP